MLYAKSSSSAFTLALLLGALQNIASAAPIPSRVASLQPSELLGDSIVPVGLAEKITEPVITPLSSVKDILGTGSLLKRAPTQHTFSVKTRSRNLSFTRKHPRELTPRAQLMNELEDSEVIDRMANGGLDTPDSIVQVPVLDTIPSVLSDLVRPDLRRHPRDFLSSLGDTLTTKLGEPLLETVPKILAEPVKILKDVERLPQGLFGRREHARDFRTFQNRDVGDQKSETAQDSIIPPISTGNILPVQPFQYLPVVGSELQSVTSSLPIQLLRRDSNSDSDSQDADADNNQDKNTDNESQEWNTPSSQKDFAKGAAEAAKKSHKSTKHRSSDPAGGMSGSLRARSNTNSAHTSETGARLIPDSNCNKT